MSKRLAVFLLLPLLLGCSPDSSDKQGREAVGAFLSQDGINLHFCFYGQSGLEQRREIKVRRTSDSEAIIEETVSFQGIVGQGGGVLIKRVPGSEATTEEIASFPEKISTTNKIELDGDKLLYFPKTILLKAPLKPGKKWPITGFRIEFRPPAMSDKERARWGDDKKSIETELKGSCEILTVGKDVVLGKELATVEVGCSLDGDYTKYKLAEGLGFIGSSTATSDEKGAASLREELCESE